MVNRELDKLRRIFNVAIQQGWLDCALRRGEILTLRWSDVDFKRRTVTVQAFNAKTARARTVTLTTRAYLELMRLWEASQQDSALPNRIEVCPTIPQKP